MDAHAYDVIASAYDAMYQDCLSRAEDRVLARLLAGYRARPLLDVGCGTGHLLDLLPVRPDDYVGTDISRGMLREAQAKFPEYEFHQCDMDEGYPGLAPHSFRTAVSLYGSFNHSWTPQFSLRLLSSLLSPCASLFYMAFTPQRAKQQTFLGHSATLHVRYWQADALRRVFEEAGFEVQVQGFYAYAHRFHFQQSALERWIWAEHRTFGRLFPDRCSYLLVKGLYTCE